MCRSQFRNTLFLILAALAITGSSVQAQSVRLQLSAYERGFFLAQESSTGNGPNLPLLSSKQVDAIRSSAIAASQNLPEHRMNLVEHQDLALKAVLSDVVSEIPSMATSNATTGVDRTFSRLIGGSHSGSILKQQTLHVLIHFDQTLVGGIIRVTADLRPAFSGIGVTNQPSSVQSMTESIDALTPETVTKIVAHLAGELQGIGALASSVDGSQSTD